MTTSLPDPIAAYYQAKNGQDIDGMLACFAGEAVVKDEGATFAGRSAIRAWMEDTTRRYNATASPTHVEQSGGLVIVSAQVSGNFPASPAQLTYRFQIAAGAIHSLEIG